MLRRSTLIVTEIMIGIIAVLGLLIGVAVWRLSSGPVALDFLTPYLESAFTASEGGRRIEVGETLLTWEGWKRTIDMRARNLRVRDAQGNLVAVFPDVDITLSLRALLQGAVAPTRVEVGGARLRIVRTADGGFEFAGATGVEAGQADPLGDFSSVMPALLGRLMSAPDPKQPLSFLNAVRIVDGKVVVVDRKEGLVWRAPVANIELRREEAGLAGEVDLAFAPAGRRADVNAAFIYDSASEVIDISASFFQVRLPAVATVVSELAPLAGLTAPLQGRASASASIDGILQRAHFELWGGQGEFAIPGLISEPLPMRSLKLEGGIDGAEDRLDLTAAALEFGTPEVPGPVVRLSGSLVSSAPSFAGDWEIQAEAKIEQVPLKELARYWPESLAPNARSWVTQNVADGIAQEVVGSTQVTVPGGRFEALEVGSLEGRMAYDGLEVHYLRPLPPVQSVSGTAAFDLDRMDFDIGGGQLGDIVVDGADVRISNLATADRSKGVFERIHIDLFTSGPIPSVLRLLDHERLDLIAGLGLHPEGSAGHAKGKTQFDFPLVKDLTFDDVEISSSAEMSDVAIADVLLGQNVTGGQLKLDLTKQGMEVGGTLELGGVPMNAVWHESFDPASDYSMIVNAEVPSLDDAGRRTLGFDFGERVQGPVSGSVSYTSNRDGVGIVAAAVSLADARLALPSLRWEKTPGTPGDAKVQVELRDGKAVAYPSIWIQAGDLFASGRGLPNEAGRDIRFLAFDKLEFAGSSLVGVTLDRRDEGYDVLISGGLLDAAHFGGSLTEAEGDGGTATAAGSAAGDSEKPLAFRVRAPTLDALTFAPGRVLEEVSVDLDRGSDGWHKIHVAGRVPRHLWYVTGTTQPSGPLQKSEAGITKNLQAKVQEDQAPSQPKTAVPDPSEDPERVRTVTVDFRPHPDGGYSLYAASNDAGAVLRALNLIDHVEGGSLELTGRSEGPLPKHSLASRVEGHKFVIHNAPAMTRLLTVASLSGLLSVLKGEGIYFQRFVGEFTLNDGLGKTDLLRAYGPSLGLTAKGTVDFDTGLSDLAGTVVPAYTFNRILGGIPLLGPLLTGGEGGGILAVTYTMKGPLADPEVKVNALSALAPGFLRGMLTGGFAAADGEAPAMALPEGPAR